MKKISHLLLMPFVTALQSLRQRPVSSSQSGSSLLSTSPAELCVDHVTLKSKAQVEEKIRLQMLKVLGSTTLKNNQTLTSHITFAWDLEELWHCRLSLAKELNFIFGDRLASHMIKPIDDLFA